MGDPMAPYAVAPQSYAGFGGPPRSQYHVTEPQHAQPPPALAQQQFQATDSTYQNQAIQPQHAQPPLALVQQQYQATPTTYQHQATQSQHAQPPPALVHQQYQATGSTYQYQATQAQHGQALPASAARPHSSYAHGKQYPQSVYATNPPKEQPKAYQSDYYGASIGFSPLTSTQSGPYPAVDSNHSRPPDYAYHSAHSLSSNGPVNLAPSKFGPKDSACQSNPMDDLISQVSRTHIENYPTATTAFRRLNLPPPEDRINEVIRDVLTQDLETENNNEMIYPDHPCFDKSREYAQKWGISGQAINNHIRLACGYRKFPVMMLLNPSPQHEWLTFEEMVRQSRTLDWIQGVLREIGLTLAEVIILDICTLLDDFRITTMNEEEKGRAMYDAYDVTRDMLQMIKPKIIVSCQCSTSFPKLGGGIHEIARELCSTMGRARSGQVKETYIGGHMIHVVQAYHPGGFLNYPDHDDSDEEYLKRLLLRVYRPCGWELKRKRVEALVASMKCLINDFGHIYGFAHGYLGFQSTCFF